MLSSTNLMEPLYYITNLGPLGFSHGVKNFKQLVNLTEHYITKIQRGRNILHLIPAPP